MKGIYVSVIVVVLLISGFIYFLFNGNPAEKEKSREIVAAYLEEHYPMQDYKITSVAYYPGVGTYIVHVISEDEETEGNIDVRNGRIITEGNKTPFEKGQK